MAVLTPNSPPHAVRGRGHRRPLAAVLGKRDADASVGYGAAWWRGCAAVELAAVELASRPTPLPPRCARSPFPASRGRIKEPWRCYASHPAAAIDIFVRTPQSQSERFASIQFRPIQAYMFKRILIANRGEIACRIIKSARRMGIETVAVYSDADRDALHVEMADTAIAIGPPPAAQSYLVIEQDRRRLQGKRRGGGASGLRLSVRAGGFRRGAGKSRHRFHRAQSGRHRRHGRQDRIRRRPRHAPRFRRFPAISASSPTTPRRSRSPRRSAIR